MTVAALAEAGAEVLGETIQELEDFFYAEDGLVAPPPDGEVAKGIKRPHTSLLSVRSPH